MTWDSIQQVLRIVLNALGAFLVGKGVVTEDMVPTLVGGVLSVSSVLWWALWQRHRVTS
jgi:hypothetical protein